ncbi:hypothetical protein EJB05_33860, partial [Eragrostis curvula]
MPRRRLSASVFSLPSLAAAGARRGNNPGEGKEGGGWVSSGLPVPVGLGDGRGGLSRPEDAGSCGAAARSGPFMDGSEAASLGSRGTRTGMRRREHAAVMQSGRRRWLRVAVRPRRSCVVVGRPRRPRMQSPVREAVAVAHGHVVMTAMHCGRETAAAVHAAALHAPSLKNAAVGAGSPSVLGGAGGLSCLSVGRAVGAVAHRWWSIGGHGDSGHFGGCSSGGGQWCDVVRRRAKFFAGQAMFLFCLAMLPLGSCFCWFGRWW